MQRNRSWELMPNHISQLDCIYFQTSKLNEARKEKLSAPHVRLGRFWHQQLIMMQQLTVICHRINFSLRNCYRRTWKDRISQTVVILLRGG